MKTSEKSCPMCGKEFFCFNYGNYAYRKMIHKNKGDVKTTKILYCCSWPCFLTLEEHIKRKDYSFLGDKK